MITLAKYHACSHRVIGEKIFKNILNGPDKLPGLSRNGPLASIPTNHGPLNNSFTHQSSISADNM